MSEKETESNKTLTNNPNVLNGVKNHDLVAKVPLVKFPLVLVLKVPWGNMQGGIFPLMCFFLMDMDSVSPYIPTSEVLDPWEWFLGV